MPMTWCDGQEIAFCRKFLGTDCLPECGHAGIQETSDILYLRPDLVRMDRVDVSETHRLERLKPLQDVRLETSVDWYADYPAQIMGDPTRSTPEMGEWMMTAWANNLARAIRLVKEDKMTPFLLDDYYSRSEMPRPYSS
jgi:creatinine amidohydrolase